MFEETYKKIENLGKTRYWKVYCLAIHVATDEVSLGFGPDTVVLVLQPTVTVGLPESVRPAVLSISAECDTLVEVLSCEVPQVGSPEVGFVLSAGFVGFHTDHVGAVDTNLGAGTECSSSFPLQPAVLV